MGHQLLFYQMVRRLENAGELSKETVFIDGTMLETCANKYAFASGQNREMGTGWVGDKIPVSAAVQPGLKPDRKNVVKT